MSASDLARNFSASSCVPIVFIGLGSNTRLPTRACTFADKEPSAAAKACLAAGNTSYSSLNCRLTSQIQADLRGLELRAFCFGCRQRGLRVLSELAQLLFLFLIASGLLFLLSALGLTHYISMSLLCVYHLTTERRYFVPGTCALSRALQGGALQRAVFVVMMHQLHPEMYLEQTAPQTFFHPLPASDSLFWKPLIWFPDHGTQLHSFPGNVLATSTPSPSAPRPSAERQRWLHDKEKSVKLERVAFGVTELSGPVRLQNRKRLHAKSTHNIDLRQLQATPKSLLARGKHIQPEKQWAKKGQVRKSIYTTRRRREEDRTIQKAISLGLVASASAC
jgi:hypothetical protein